MSLRLKILVVEDDPIQADGLARLLGSCGYFVDIAVNGRQALRRICTGMFHVALIDYRLPEIDGLGIAQVVQNLRSTFDRPRLVALTSAPQDLVAGSAEFDEVLGKPIVLEMLRGAIERGRPVDYTTGEAARATQPAGRTQGALAKPAPSASTEKRGRVLLVDDDEHLREFLRLTLEFRGFEVDVARDGLEAVSRVRTSAYDVVVVDFNMPKLDGLATAKVIYDLTARPTRPRIIALTSTPCSLVAQDRKWRLVLDEVVSKANGAPDFLAAVENCMDYRVHLRSEPSNITDVDFFIKFAQGMEVR